MPTGNDPPESQLGLDLPLVKDAESNFGRRHSAVDFAGDVAQLGTEDLLTVLLGSREREACRRVALAHPSLRELCNLYPAEFRSYGLTPGAVSKITAAFELAKRCGEEEFVAGAPFRGSADVYAHYRERLGDELVEHFYLILLDNKHRKLRDVQVSQGSLTSSVVHPRDVFMVVIRNSAAAVIFVHNHPSGDPTPSQEDLALTRRLREVGELLGVRVLDHIIIGKGRYVSFVDDGYW